MAQIAEKAVVVEENLPGLHDVTDIEDLKKALSSGADINEQNNFGETPLLCAIRRNVDMQVIEEFLNREADVNALDCWGITPLYCAIARHANNPILIRKLLENGGDIRSGKGQKSNRFLDSLVTRSDICAKLLIKFKFLKNHTLVQDFKSTSQIPRNYYCEYQQIVELDITSSKYKYLADFLDECSMEILQMQSVNLLESFTLLDFVKPKTKQLASNKERAAQTQQLYKELNLRDYPIYKELIIVNIGRDNLLRKLDSIFICTPSVSKHKIFVLNFDLMYYVAEYLLDQDLLNIVLASMH